MDAEARSGAGIDGAGSDAGGGGTDGAGTPDGTGAAAAGAGLDRGGSGSAGGADVAGGREADPSVKAGAGGAGTALGRGGRLTRPDAVSAPLALTLLREGSRDFAGARWADGGGPTDGFGADWTAETGSCEGRAEGGVVGAEEMAATSSGNVRSGLQSAIPSRHASDSGVTEP